MNAAPQEPDLKNVYLNMGGLLVPVVLALAVTSPAQPVRNLGCGTGKLVLNVTYRVQNDVDTGIRGNNWAFDTYTRAVRVWRTAPGRFCSLDGACVPDAIKSQHEDYFLYQAGA